MIYFMQPINGGPVKIGFTDNLSVRHKQLENHYGLPLAILAVMEGGVETESEIHQRFDHLRYEGRRKSNRRPEQFRPAQELMEFIGMPLFVSVNPDIVEVMEPKKGGTMIRVTEEVAEALRKVCALENMTAAEFAAEYYLPVIQKRLPRIDRGRI